MPKSGTLIERLVPLLGTCSLLFGVYHAATAL